MIFENDYDCVGWPRRLYSVGATPRIPLKLHAYGTQLVLVYTAAAPSRRGPLPLHAHAFFILFFIINIYIIIIYNI